MDQPAAGETPKNEAELSSELQRLNDKLASTSDVDIQRALAARIAEIQAQLKVDIHKLATSSKSEGFDTEAKANVQAGLNELQANLVAQAEVVRPKPTGEEETRLRAELTSTSHRLYSEEDPTRREEIKARVAELQALLGIDVGKLAGSEMSANALPDLNLPVKKGKEKPKAKTDLAELQALVAQQSAKVRQTENRIELEIPESTEPPTPEQLDASEKLVQQARVEKIRGNKDKVRQLLEEAVRAAPGAPGVLEMLGDDHAERKQLGKALAYYRRAAKLDLTNVNLERKVAMTALGVDASGISHSPTLDDSAIPMASRRAALLISILFPGLGHIVLGKTTRGWVTLAVWLLCVVWLILGGKDIANVFAGFAGGRTHGNMIILLPIVVMLVVFIMTLADFKGPQETARQPVDRPRPPVDLPFE